MGKYISVAFALLLHLSASSSLSLKLQPSLYPPKLTSRMAASKNIAPRFRVASIFGDKEKRDVLDNLEAMNEFTNLQYDLQSSSQSKMGIFYNQKKLGLILMSSGLFLTLLGMMLFFERNLLRLGNLAFVAGTSLLIGPKRVSRFFMQRKRIRATVSIVTGIVLVLMKWPKLGILLELFGVLNLFGNMFPVIYRIAKTFPIMREISRLVEENNRAIRSRDKYHVFDDSKSFMNRESVL